MRRRWLGRPFAFRYLLVIMLACVAWCAVISLTDLAGPNQAVAQPPEDAPNPPEVDPQTETTVTEPVPEEDAPEEPDSYLEWFAGALGWFFGPLFLVVSFIMVALLVMNFLAMGRERVIPAELIEGFEELLDEKQYQEAYDLAKADGSFLGLILSAGMARLSGGYDDSIKAMGEVGEEESMKMEHRLSHLALIGNISPMLGLFGTVYGMMNAFSLIASGSMSTEPTELMKMLAMEISTALVTTFVGLAIAIPAIAVFNILRNRMSRLVLEVGIVSEGLMDRFRA